MNAHFDPMRVLRLQAAAEAKLKALTGKRELCTSLLQDTEAQIDAIQTALNYASLGDERRQLLTGVLLQPGEYGDEALLSQQEVDSLRETLARAQSYRNTLLQELERLKAAIPFLTEDIARLQKVLTIHPTATRYLASLGDAWPKELEPLPAAAAA